ncbi:DUF4268 domain-containing protein [Flavobacterium sp.]|uniref:DUF4268 domain-containing protein n=1 Tax=Flavobacterium sp. TaxID=239 RepID=UPI003529AC5E
MFSKEEAKRIKKEFWIEFAAAYPRKWLLYNTGVKDFAFKFYVDTKKAHVILDIETKNEENRKIYFEKMESLKTILLDDYVNDAIFEQDYILENGKIVSRIWTQLDGVSVNNKNTWEAIFDFFNNKMTAFELFYYEYEEYLKDLEINT